MIISHIVGLNNILKKEFIEYIDTLDNDIDVYDLDDISKIIVENERYIEFATEYDNGLNRTENLQKMGLLWKTMMQKEIDNIVEHSRIDNIIIIGLSNFVLDQRIKIDIPTDNKFFVNIEPKLNAKYIVLSNLIQYKLSIVNGEFPLDYLDHNYLIEQRKKLMDVYINKNYIMKRYSELLKWCDNIHIGIPNVYYASYKRYENTIVTLTNPVGYSSKWLALASIFPKTDIKRGMRGGKPYIEMANPLIKSKMMTPCYLYELIPHSKVDEYRYIVTNNHFIKRSYISDIYDELIRLNVCVK